jgi:Domain of unknown function (DUF4352)
MRHTLIYPIRPTSRGFSHDDDVRWGHPASARKFVGEEKMTDQPITPPPAFNSPKDAKAQAKAEKAYRKATRPWFKKKRIIVPLALVVLFAIGKAASGGSGTSAAPSATTPAAAAPAAAAPKAAAPKAAALPGIGAKVRDGKFEFVVTGVEHPGKSFQSQFGTTETAQGEFVIVRINVTNIGDAAQMIDSSSQQLFNVKGQKFAPSSAIMSLKGADKIFITNINPGNSVTGAPLLFDVAPGTKIASIELHDSPFSGGVKVKLA